MDPRLYIDSELARIGDFGRKVQPRAMHEVFDGTRLVGVLVETDRSTCLIKAWTPDCGTVLMIEKNPTIHPDWRLMPIGTHKEPGHLLDA